MNFYLYFRKLHLYFTLIALIPLIVVAFTGLLLIFEAEITQWQAPAEYKNNSEQIIEAKQLAQIRQHIHQLESEYRPCRLSYIRHDIETLSLPWVYLSCPRGSRTFVINLNTNLHYPLEREGFRLITDLHRTLLLNRVDYGKEGRILVGISSLILILNIVLGFILWFIRGKKLKLKKQQFKLVTKAGINLRRLHAVTALYISPILVVIIITGISWTWREEINQGLMYLQNKAQMSTRVFSQPSQGYDSLASLDEIYQKIEQQYSHYHVQGLAPAFRRSDIVSLRLIDKISVAYTPLVHVQLDAYTLKEKYRVDSWDAEFKDSLHAYGIVKYGLHTGFVFGTTGKWLWAIAILLFIASTMMLGVYLWLKRRAIASVRGAV